MIKQYKKLWGNKEIIFNIIKRNPTTVPDIKETLKKEFQKDIDTSDIHVYIKRLIDSHKIVVLEKIGRYNVYSINKDEVLYKLRMKIRDLHNKIDNLNVKYNNIKNLLSFVNDFFKNNVGHLLQDNTIKDFILNHEEFDKVEEVVSNNHV